MQFSAVEIRFVVTTQLNSTFTNDLKRKYIFPKNVHSYRLSSFNTYFGIKAGGNNRIPMKHITDCRITWKNSLE